MNADAWLFATICVATLVIAVPFDWFVAYRFLLPAVERPHIPVLTLAALRSMVIAIASTIFAALALVVVWFIVTHERVLDAGQWLFLLWLGAIVPSLSNIYALRGLGRLDGIDE